MVDIVLPRAIGQSASVAVGTTTTLPPGSPASVVNVGSAQNAVLNFSIPAGASSGSGDVVGPASATSGALAVYSGTTGKLIANGPSLGVGASGSVPTRADADARYQAIDAGLTSLAGLSTVGLYYLSAADVWSPVTIGTNLTFTGGTLSATGGGGGSGDVVGPASSTDNQIALFNGTTGKLLKTGALVSTFAPLSGPTFTGVPAAPTATAGTNTAQLATTAFVTAAAALKANIASPAFTGTPTAPTATAGTNTTQLATTAFVAAANALKADIADVINTQTGTTYTLQASDNGKVVELSNAAAITLTIPVLTVGFNCLIRQVAAGVPSWTASGTTLRNRQSHTKLAGQWAEASISYRTTTEVVISGDTAA
jgi:hypothetical protein